jgi:alanine racemase
MPRPIHATIDLGALAHNFEIARTRAEGARVWAVIKANAYGHGLLRAAQAMGRADGFALLDLNEAVRLRNAAITKPILLLEGIFSSDDLAVVGANDLTVVVHSPEQLRMLELTRTSRPIATFLKMNSGMNRLGFRPAQFVEAHRRLIALPNVQSVGLMTHFADADGERGVAEQLQRFEEATAGLPGERSVANSAALLRHPVRGSAWVRPGIMLYGCSPFADASAYSLRLKPAMTLTSELIAMQTLAPGDRVGYSGSFVATEPMRIGVVACGYADGYPRHAPTGTPVVVDGQRTRTVGRVSMDMITVDLTGIAQPRVGSEVTLWGEGLSADEVASAAGTVSYELLCALAPRVPVAERK